jgi:hypothetical protein
MALKGSGSDVTSSFITAAAADPDGISTAASVSGAANLTIGGALASGGTPLEMSPYFLRLMILVLLLQLLEQMNLIMLRLK